MGAGSNPYHLTQDPAVIAASMIGTWQWNIPDDRVNCDRTNARILGLTAREAAQGVPLTRIVAAIHPEDRDYFRETTAPARIHGGSVSLIVRTQPAPSTQRRVIVRGEYAPDSGFGRGVLIDISDLNSPAETPTDLRTAEAGARTRLAAIEDAIETSMALRTTLEPHVSGPTRLLLDLLLYELGRTLAALITEPSH